MCRLLPWTNLKDEGTAALKTNTFYTGLEMEEGDIRPRD